MIYYVQAEASEYSSLISTCSQRNLIFYYCFYFRKSSRMKKSLINRDYRQTGGREKELTTIWRWRQSRRQAK